MDNDSKFSGGHDDVEEIIPRFDVSEEPSDQDLVEMELDQDGLDAVFEGLDEEDGDSILFTYEGDFDDETQ